MTFSGQARDALLSSQDTEKLNFDTNYITIIIGLPREKERVYATFARSLRLV